MLTGLSIPTWSVGVARGSVRKRGSTWTVVLDVGPNPVTGRRRQKSKGGYGTRKAAEAALRELSAAVDARRYVERSTTTVGEYLDEWLAVVQPRLRPTSWNCSGRRHPGRACSGPSTRWDQPSCAVSLVPEPQPGTPRGRPGRSRR
jgi:Arm DNA-binding domain